MLTVELNGGNKMEFPEPVSLHQIAKSINQKLYKKAIAGYVDGVLKDLSYEVEKEHQKVSIITEEDPESLDVIRHSTAHLLAQATKELFPEALVTIGPVIKDGFYYDFSYKRPFTEEDLAKIEAKMQKLVKRNLSIKRHEFSKEEAIKIFSEMGEKYKVEIINDLPESETLSFYKQGDFIDLCRGPHVSNTNKIKAFKLLNVAGAYWRGDHNNEMLQRIYGTSWLTKEDLERHLTKIEEAKKRDHRILGKRLGLFHIQEQAPGMVFWHPKGWEVYLRIQAYMRDKLKDYGYQEVNTPLVLSRNFWQDSGHWEKFRDNMLSLEIDEADYAIKPMNCPCHVQIFNQGVKSYKDLPIRMSEFGVCHRHEPSGSLHGLLRVRNFTQDDAHIFCQEEQILSEVKALIDFVKLVYKDFGFTNIMVKLSTRPEQRVGSCEVWDQAESALAQALEEKGLEYELSPGEGAFYGPKIEFSLMDSLERVWQCGTVQLDFAIPERLGATYIDKEGKKKYPVMIHRAILGTFERFIGILIENYAGALPLWLVPTQVMIINITDHHSDYALELKQQLKASGIRVEADLRNEKISYKIRENTMQKIPYMLIIGEHEVASKSITVRKCNGEDLGNMQAEDFIQLINKQILSKT